MKKILKILAIIFSLIIGISACSVIFGDDTATDATQISSTTAKETTMKANTTVAEQTTTETETTQKETTTEKETTSKKETTTKQTCTTKKATTTQKETTVKADTTTKKETTTRKPTTTKKVEQSPSKGEMVWIPTNGGTKYHTRSGCSNMDSPSNVTLAEAKRLGFTACKKCYG